jgi:ribosome-associated protein
MKITMHQESDPDQELPSKTQRKTEMLALQKLGEQLTGFSNANLNKLPISDRLRAAIVEYKRLPNSHGARRRQIQFIGKLMRESDSAAIAEAIEKMLSPPLPDIGRMKKLDKQCTRILEFGDAEIQQLIEGNPSLDRQVMRRFYRDFHTSNEEQAVLTRDRLMDYLVKKLHS